MPEHIFKLLERMRASKDNWRRRDLDELYLGFGFILKHGSNHDIVKHPDFPEIRATLPRHNKLLKVYVADAVKNIDKLLALQKAQEESESGDSDD